MAGRLCFVAKNVIVKPVVCRHTLLRTFSVSGCKHGDPIGFIGLGNMGAHMAKNLIKNNHSVVVFDMVPQAVQGLEAAGARSAATPADVAAQTKTLVTMLPANDHVRAVYAGKDGIFSGAQAGSLFIDSSTVEPVVSKEMEVLAKDKGVTFMDAPVSGGVVAARDALLTFMVGGDQSRFDETKALLSNMGKNVVHCGPCGTGQAAKICNNMLLGISMIGTAEAMSLGMKLGLDPKLLAGILNMSSGRCWSSEMYNPVPGVVEGIPASNNYQGGFGGALMAKDLGLAQSAATATKTPTPMGSLAHQLYRIMTNSGYADKDFAAAYLFLQEMAKDQ